MAFKAHDIDLALLPNHRGFDRLEGEHFVDSGKEDFVKLFIRKPPKAETTCVG
jgi:hypothetical protein